MAKKKASKISIASVLVMLFAIVAIVAFFVPSMAMPDDNNISGLDMTMEMFDKTTAIDILKNPDLATRFSWSMLSELTEDPLNILQNSKLKNVPATTEAMEVFAFLSVISAGVMLVLGLFGVISKKKNKFLSLLTLIFCLLTLALGAGGLICGIVMQSIFTVGETSTILLSAGTIMTTAAGVLGTLSHLLFKRK